jgi:hypothetical protein
MAPFDSTTTLGAQEPRAGREGTQNEKGQEPGDEDELERETGQKRAKKQTSRGRK